MIVQPRPPRAVPYEALTWAAFYLTCLLLLGLAVFHIGVVQAFLNAHPEQARFADSSSGLTTYLGVWLAGQSFFTLYKLQQQRQAFLLALLNLGVACSTVYFAIQHWLIMTR